SNLVRPELARGHLGQRDERGLRGVVAHRSSGLAPIDRADIDDRAAAALLHFFRAKARQSDGREEILIKRGLPRLLVQRRERLRVCSTGIVDEHVYPSKPLGGGRDPSFGSGGVAGIERLREYFRTSRTQFPFGRGQLDGSACADAESSAL